MQSETTPEKEQSNFLFFLNLVFKNWKLLLATYFIVGTVTVIVLLVLPKWYKSEATVVILDEQSSSIANVMSQFNSLGLGFASQSNVETYMEYVHTKKMYNRLIKEFNLDEVYETKFIEDTYDAIFNNLSVTDNENRTFNISFSYEEDPQKAAEITNFIFKELDKIVLEVDKAEASNFRKYIEDYYNDIRSKLKTDEDSLVRFQENTGILNIEIQTSSTIEGLAELETQRIKYEIEKKYVNEIYEDPSRANELNVRISAIQSKINDLRSSSNIGLIAINDIPEKGAKFLRLKRDIIVGEKVAEFLRLQYEQALLDEKKISSNLYLIDPPQVPERKFKPQRTKILFIVMFFTVLLSLLFIRVKDFISENSVLLKSLLK